MRHQSKLMIAILGLLLMAGPAAAQQPGPPPGGGGGQGQATIVLDATNNALIIKATPSQHRRIGALIQKIATGRLTGERLETRVFNVRNMSPEQLFRILEFEQPTFQRNTTLVFPETQDGSTVGR